MRNRIGEPVLRLHSGVKINQNQIHESKSISKASLRELPHREAKKCITRYLQKCAAQAAARLATLRIYAPTPRC